jgi:hypothetical protein
MLGFGKSGKTRRCQVVCYTRSQLPNDKCAKTISRLVEISMSKAEAGRYLWHQVYGEYKQIGSSREAQFYLLFTYAVL